MGMQNRAMYSIPKRTFAIHASDQGDIGVFADKVIPQYTFIGPYEGQLDRIKDKDRYSWKIAQGRVADTSTEHYSNYFRFIRFPRVLRDQNVYMFQHKGELYYRASRDIHKDEELLLYVDVQFNDKYYKPPHLDIDTETPTCSVCCVAFSKRKQQKLHERVCKSKLHDETFRCRKCNAIIKNLDAQLSHERDCGKPKPNFALQKLLLQRRKTEKSPKSDHPKRRKKAQSTLEETSADEIPTPKLAAKRKTRERRFKTVLLVEAKEDFAAQNVEGRTLEMYGGARKLKTLVLDNNNEDGEPELDSDKNQPKAKSAFKILMRKQGKIVPVEMIGEISDFVYEKFNTMPATFSSSFEYDPALQEEPEMFKAMLLPPEWTKKKKKKIMLSGLNIDSQEEDNLSAEIGGTQIIPALGKVKRKKIEEVNVLNTDQPVRFEAMLDPSKNRERKKETIMLSELPIDENFESQQKKRVNVQIIGNEVIAGPKKLKFGNPSNDHSLELNVSFPENTRSEDIVEVDPARFEAMFHPTKKRVRKKKTIKVSELNIEPQQKKRVNIEIIGNELIAAPKKLNFRKPSNEQTLEAYVPFPENTRNDDILEADPARFEAMVKPTKKRRTKKTVMMSESNIDDYIESLQKNNVGAEISGNQAKPSPKKKRKNVAREMSIINTDGPVFHNLRNELRLQTLASFPYKSRDEYILGNLDPLNSIECVYLDGGDPERDSSETESIPSRKSNYHESDDRNSETSLYQSEAQGVTIQGDLHVEARDWIDPLQYLEANDITENASIISPKKRGRPKGPKTGTKSNNIQWSYDSIDTFQHEINTETDEFSVPKKRGRKKGSTNNHQGFDDSFDSELLIVAPKKKGRPLGSKNRKKFDLVQEHNVNTAPKKRGRPKGKQQTKSKKKITGAPQYRAEQTGEMMMGAESSVMNSIKLEHGIDIEEAPINPIHDDSITLPDNHVQIMLFKTEMPLEGTLQSETNILNQDIMIDGDINHPSLLIENVCSLESETEIPLETTILNEKNILDQDITIYGDSNQPKLLIGNEQPPECSPESETGITLEDTLQNGHNIGNEQLPGSSLESGTEIPLEDNLQNENILNQDITDSNHPRLLIENVCSLESETESSLQNRNILNQDNTTELEKTSLKSETELVLQGTILNEKSIVDQDMIDGDNNQPRLSIGNEEPPECETEIGLEDTLQNENNIGNQQLSQSSLEIENKILIQDITIYRPELLIRNEQPPECETEITLEDTLQNENNIGNQRLLQSSLESETEIPLNDNMQSEHNIVNQDVVTEVNNQPKLSLENEELSLESKTEIPLNDTRQSENNIVNQDVVTEVSNQPKLSLDIKELSEPLESEREILLNDIPQSENIITRDNTVEIDSNWPKLSLENEELSLESKKEIPLNDTMQSESNILNQDVATEERNQSKLSLENKELSEPLESETEILLNNTPQSKNKILNQDLMVEVDSNRQKLSFENEKNCLESKTEIPLNNTPQSGNNILNQDFMVKVDSNRQKLSFENAKSFLECKTEIPLNDTRQSEINIVNQDVIEEPSLESETEILLNDTPQSKNIINQDITVEVHSNRPELSFENEEISLESKTEIPLNNTPESGKNIVNKDIATEVESNQPKLLIDNKQASLEGETETPLDDNQNKNSILNQDNTITIDSNTLQNETNIPNEDMIEIGSAQPKLLIEKEQLSEPSANSDSHQKVHVLESDSTR